MARMAATPALAGAEALWPKAGAASETRRRGRMRFMERPDGVGAVCRAAKLRMRLLDHQSAWVRGCVSANGLEALPSEAVPHPRIPAPLPRYCDHSDGSRSHRCFFNSASSCGGNGSRSLADVLERTCDGFRIPGITTSTSGFARMKRSAMSGI